MGNISVLATTNHATLDALVASNARLSATTEKQHATIDYLWKNNGTLQARGKSGWVVGANPSSTTGRLSSDQEKHLITALKNWWYIVGFCSTRGYSVNHSHTSVTCNCQRGGHIELDTKANPVGPGADTNRGWYAGI